MKLNPIIVKILNYPQPGRDRGRDRDGSTGYLGLWPVDIALKG